MAQPELGRVAIRIEAPARQLPMRVRPAAPMSDDELFELCASNRDLRVERTPEGELIFMSPTGGEAGRRNFGLIGQLAGWVARVGGGVGFDSSTGFLLPNGAERAPDAAWVRSDRWEALTTEQRRKLVPFCPDFVVELRSPSDSVSELVTKMEEYRACGARLGWLIDVDGRRVLVFRPGRETEVVDGADEISGEPEMPGLKVDLAALR